MDHREVGWGGMDWMDLVQDRAGGRQELRGISWLAEDLLASQEGFS
jgi:hypothetical protein